MSCGDWIYNYEKVLSNVAQSIHACIAKRLILYIWKWASIAATTAFTDYNALFLAKILTTPLFLGFVAVFFGGV